LVKSEAGEVEKQPMEMKGLSIEHLLLRPEPFVDEDKNSETRSLETPQIIFTSSVKAIAEEEPQENRELSYEAPLQF
jgi:hypothetical protein